MKLIKKEIIVSLIVIVVIACIVSIGLVFYHNGNNTRNRGASCSQAHECKCEENATVCNCLYFDVDGEEQPIECPRPNK